MNNRDIYWRRYKIQETLYIGQWCLSLLQSRHLGTSHVLLIQISCHAVFSWISSMVWNLFPFKGDFSFGKSQKSQVPNLGYGETESPGWFDVLPKNCTRPDAWAGTLLHCCDEDASHQFPIAVAFWNIWIISGKECSSLMQNLMQVHCSTQSIILNMTATQYTCSLNAFTTRTD